MANTCKKEGCYENIKCKFGEPLKKDCEHYIGKEPIVEGTNNEFLPEDNSYLLSWTGNSMGLDDLKLVVERNSPQMISLVGAPNSGKTTFLGLLYLLLGNGQFLKDHKYSHTYSILGWEYIANFMRYQTPNRPDFPPHTSSYGGRDVGLLHLGVKQLDNLKDLLFTDVPGEWFNNWSIDENDSNAGRAKWIDDNATGIILFLDSEGLSSDESGRFKITTQKLIRRLSNTVGKRKVAILWAKADLKNNINPSIINILQREIENKIQNHRFFDISVQHGKKNIYHNNILQTIDWLLGEEDVNTKPEKISLYSDNSEDYLFRYRG